MRSPIHAGPRRPGRRAGWRAPLLVLGVAAALAGCSDPLSVDNPNNLTQDDLDNPAAATALVNGVLATVTEGIGRIAAPYAVATDELHWVGSRDAWSQLDYGFLSDPANAFTDAAFPYVAEARWLADEAIRKLSAWDEDGALRDRRDLARAYLYGGIIYITIADVFDDFAFSDRLEPAPPVGENEMGLVYDTAVAYLDRGLALSRELGLADLELRMLALRARATFTRAVWGKLNPKGATPAEPLVADADAVEDARAVLDRIGTASDWSYELDYSAATVSSGIAFAVNERGELQIGSDYVALDPEDAATIEGVRLPDPLTGEPDPVIEAALSTFLDAGAYAPFTVVSARELHLILAEAALADRRTEDAARHINHVRALDGLPGFDPERDAISARELLQHERRVNLFLQARRLADLYRFGEQAEGWQADSDAVTAPGTFLPIPATERRANPHLDG